MATIETSHDTLLNLIQTLSVSRLKQMSGHKNIQVVEITPEPLVFAHWMSIILISGRSLRVVFKAHFMSKSAKFFAAKTYKCSRDDVSDDRAIDFFREYCNLTGGRLKVDLALDEIKVGVSLPVLARGFDEVCNARPPGSKTNFWRVECGEEKIDCSTHIEIFENFELDKSVTSEKYDQGDVEFL